MNPDGMLHCCLKVLAVYLAGQLVTGLLIR
jgi:hypothetical protein